MTPSSARLPDEVLARRSQLPLKPQATRMDGATVALVPYSEDHAAALYAACNGSPIQMGDRHLDAYDAEALIWRYMFHGPFASQAAFTEYANGLLAIPNAAAFTVVMQAWQQPVGIVTLMSNVPDFLKIELGNIWYSPIAQRTNANLEATTLLLRWAFERGYRRVEWKCDAANARSRRAALRMGFQFEGIQEAHMIIKGHNRDTAWFRILDHEWPQVEAGLQALLAVKHA